MLNRSKTRARLKRNALLARMLAAVDIDRAEHRYRLLENQLTTARKAGDIFVAAAVLLRFAEAARMWSNARWRGLMIERIWR